MSDQLMPGDWRRGQVADEVEQEAATQTPRAPMVRMAIVALNIIALGIVIVSVGVGVLVGSVVSVVAGIAAGSIAFGISLFTIGILLGLNS